MKSKLLHNYPELLEKSILPFGIECDIGWYNLIEAVFSVACQPLHDINWRMDMYEDDSEQLKSLHEQRKKEIQNLPSFVQIKEKFGTLRIYTDNINDSVAGAIMVAERLSACICESCGSTGERRSMRGWISTSCRSCAIEKYSEKEVTEWEKEQDSSDV